jgi:hypothetical protein
LDSGIEIGTDEDFGGLGESSYFRGGEICGKFGERLSFSEEGGLLGSSRGENSDTKKCSYDEEEKEGKKGYFSLGSEFGAAH